jgi:hypothetical protein
MLPSEYFLTKACASSIRFSPNMLMLGRETSTPLDLVYDMPPGIKPVPANMWVWELWERIEEAHALVRKYSEGSILRQKTYHDKRALWERFEANDIVGMS